ncbi:hypothetical protein EVAR_30131_1 [Eumeta japonica]|uniref:Uncharacterized protein n=1 Tax=Eumeta variegata TaxID=151549 RepID=A0A4C1WH73_EUMVA|nr:hypothetical protein EVAR_30131_1 [Eumeta japonica]
MYDQEVYGGNTQNMHNFEGPTYTEELVRASLGFELVLAMKHHTRRLFITGLQNSNVVMSLSLSDEFRDGYPSTTVNNIDAVYRMIETDTYVTYHEIRVSLIICMSQIQSIPQKYLGMKKLYSGWIPHNLAEAQKTDRVTCCNDTLTKFKEEASNLVWDITTGKDVPKSNSGGRAKCL